MKTYTANDSVGISTRYTTDEGFLVARGVLARTGTQAYLAGEIGLDGDPLRKVTLYRPPEEVFHPKSIASFDGKPLTINHPPVLVNKTNWREYSNGNVKNVERTGEETLAGDITFTTDDAIEALDSGKKELSNGYVFTLDMTPGTAPCGTAYDGVQRNIRGNHIALVDKGRCGSACRVLDSDPNPDINHKDKTMKKIVVDGIPMELEETQAGVVEKLAADRDAAMALANEAETKLQSANDAHKEATDKMVADHAAEIDLLRKDVVTPEVRDALIPVWAAMVETIKKHSAIDTAGKTCNALRREFVEAKAADAALAALVAPVMGGVAAADANDEVIKAAFGVMAAALDAQAAAPAGNGGERAVGDKLAGNAKSVPVMDARALFIHNQANRA